MDYSDCPRPVAAGSAAAAGDGGQLQSDSGCGERGGLWRVMNCGPLRVTRAGASESGLPLCVTSYSGQSKFHVLSEPKDSKSGHGVRV